MNLHEELYRIKELMDVPPESNQPKLGGKLSDTLKPSIYTKEELLTVTHQAVSNALHQMVGNKAGVLLSGGVDSSITAILCHEINPDTLYFTIGTDVSHPDVQAAQRFAKEMNLTTSVYIPDEETRKQARGLFTKEYSEGDEAVLLILKEAAKYVTDILCTDGIDELMGGYWEHRGYQIRKKPIEYAFDKYWDELESKHLNPLKASAKAAGVNVITVFTDPNFMNYVSRIPFEDRVNCNTSKILWKDIARMVGVPEWVINRQKLGFCDALKKFEFLLGV
jgi:asparagine synthase (glutamine-hydrolysing)